MNSPVYENIFTVGLDGPTSTPERMATIAGCTAFDVNINNTIAEWTPLTAGLFKRRRIIRKSLSVKISAKRVYGDPGNDYIASLAWARGTYRGQTAFSWTFPTGDGIRCKALVDVTGLGGEATDPDAMEITIYSTGAVTYVPLSPDRNVTEAVSSLNYQPWPLRGFTEEMEEPV